MAIAGRKPTAEVAVKPSLPQIEPTGYRSTTMDNNDIPLLSLLAYIDGSPWSVTYYAQVVSKDNDLREIDPGQSAVYQQYQKTNNMELRVTQALSSSYDSERGISSVNGSATIYPFMVPNVSDYFTAETADTERAIYRITQVERKTFNRHSAFAVEYELVGYVSQLAQLHGSLESKSVRTYFFSKDRLLEGLMPVVKTEEYEKITDLSAQYRELVKAYFQAFFDKRYGTLIIPGQDHAVYDHFLVEFLMHLVETGDAEQIREMRRHTPDNDRFIEQTQFWEILLCRDYRALDDCNTKMVLVHKHAFHNNPFIRGIYYSGIGYLVYPMQPDTSGLVGDACYHVPPASLEVLQLTTGTHGRAFSEADNQYQLANKTIQLVKDLDPRGCYVLSESFYQQGREDLSTLEILTRDYLKMQTIDLDMLSALVSSCKKWSRLQQFYYWPILMLLIKQASRSQYT